MQRLERELSVTNLHHLVDVCREAEIGLLNAASRSQKPGLKKFLGGEALQHSLFIVELQLELRKLGEAAKLVTPNFSLPGWKELSPTQVLPLALSSDEGVLRLCEEGGRSVLREYSRTLHEKLPPDVVQLVERQRSDLQLAHDRLRQLQIQLQKGDLSIRGHGNTSPMPSGRKPL